MIIISYSLSCRFHLGCTLRARNSDEVGRTGSNLKVRAVTAERAAAPLDSSKVAEDIGIAVLELADRARDAGLSSIGYLLEMVALEAGAEAAARQWPADGADS